MEEKDYIPLEGKVSVRRRRPPWEVGLVRHNQVVLLYCVLPPLSTRLRHNLLFFLPPHEEGQEEKRILLGRFPRVRTFGLVYYLLLLAGLLLCACVCVL